MVGKSWNMHKRAFQGLKRTFMHVSGLPPPYFDNKTNFIKYLVLLSKYGGGSPETCINVRFRAWNARLCMFQDFPHHILIIKLIYKVFGFIIKIWWGKSWNTCINTAFQGLNVRFRAWNARLCMFQDFHHHILIIKLIYKVFVFIIKIWWGKSWNMHKRAFQGLKRTFMLVSGLPPPYFDNKTNFIKYLVLLSKYGGEVLKHA